MALWLCPRKNTQLYEKLTTLMGSLGTLFPNPPRFEPHVTITTHISVNLDNPGQTREDVDRILSASAAALALLPPNHTKLVTLGRVALQRHYFKKLYFQVADDPNLMSFARVIHELFVLIPEEEERANQQANPHLYTTPADGGAPVRRALSRKRAEADAARPVDMAQVHAVARARAAEWGRAYDPHLSLVYNDLHPIDNALWRTIRTRILDYLNVDNCDAEGLRDNGLGWDGGVLKLVWCEGAVADWVVLGSVDLH